MMADQLNIPGASSEEDISGANSEEEFIPETESESESEVFIPVAVKQEASSNGAGDQTEQMHHCQCTHVTRPHLTPMRWGDVLVNILFFLLITTFHRMLTNSPSRILGR